MTRTGHNLKHPLQLNPAKSFQLYVNKCLSLLGNITSQGLITQGRSLHAHFIKKGTSLHRTIAVKLLNLYLNHRKLAEANEISKQFNGFDLVVHNCLLKAYVQWGDLDGARKLFDEMPQRNEVSWATLISGFMKFGRVEESMSYFERNPFHDVFSWTAGISGFVQNGFSIDAVKLFLKLLECGIRPNEVTFTSVVKACGELGESGLGMGVICLIFKSGFKSNLSVSNSLITLCLRIGELDMARRVFDMMEERDVVSWTAMLDVYVEMGDLGEARMIFDMMPERSEVSWSAMISRYRQSGYPEESLKLFRQMVEEGFKINVSCFSSVLSALASVKALQAGMNIHGHIIKVGNDWHTFVSSSLIDFYCKCGRTKDGIFVFKQLSNKNVVSWNAMMGGYGMNGQMEEAKELFDGMPLRNNTSWATIIAGYVENKQFEKVFEVYSEMLLVGEIPDKSIFSSLLHACASTTSLEKGKELHGMTIKSGNRYNVFVGTALIDMYAKSGDIESSRKLFDRMPEKNDITWTAMIQGLAESGFAEESLNLFEEMKTSSVTPNEFTLLSVLFACSHCGLVDKGLQYFNSMQTVHGVKPKGKHYTCVVDMLSRAGRLSEAEAFINSMPFQPETNALAALLSGCKTYRNEELAERTVGKLWEMAEKDSRAYILLSHVYALAGRWRNVLQIRKLMNKKGLRKTAGCSWVEVRNQVHSFKSKDENHSNMTEIYGILELLRTEMLCL